MENKKQIIEGKITEEKKTEEKEVSLNNVKYGIIGYMTEEGLFGIQLLNNPNIVETSGIASLINKFVDSKVQNNLHTKTPSK